MSSPKIVARIDILNCDKDFDEHDERFVAAVIAQALHKSGFHFDIVAADNAYLPATSMLEVSNGLSGFRIRKMLGEDAQVHLTVSAGTEDSP